MKKIEHSVNPEAGKYDFDGQCAPHNGPHSGFSSFTLGIFQWVLKNGERGAAGKVKRSKIIERIKGDFAKPDAAYNKATARCFFLNNNKSAK